MLADVPASYVLSRSPEMLIAVRELALRPVEFVQDLAPGMVDLGPEVRQVTPLHVAGKAELIEEREGTQTISDIRLRGEFGTLVELSCARCLEPVRLDVDADFDLVYRPLGVDRKGDEYAISEAETEIGYYQGEGLRLEDALKEQVLLTLPVKALCREECKGLCPHCGKNWNQGTCQCEDRTTDPRWAALEELKNKLQ